MKPSPLETLAAGFANSKPPGAERPPFQPDARMERLRRLRRREPDVFARFGSTQRIALGFYEESRRQAGIEDDDHDDRT
ncbi:MAG: hypothetical protein H0W06_11165 [Chloroflexia bacterium]|nr:hypothetical protein [Chloroflexia bacterium]